MSSLYFFFFFFNDTATTEIYTLSLHDALPISSTPAAAAPSASLRISVCSRLRSVWFSETWRRYTRSEEHTSELQSQSNLVCRLLLEKKKKKKTTQCNHTYTTTTQHTQPLIT